MNIEQGGEIHPNIFWRIVQFEKENQYEHFPGYGSETLVRYLGELERSQQFATVYGGFFNEPIAFAAWWYLPTLEMCREKSWQKPFPDNLDDGDFAYIDFTFALPNYRSFNLVRKLLMECHREHPEKHICFHRYEGTNEMKFYHRKPLFQRQELQAA